MNGRRALAAVGGAAAALLGVGIGELASAVVAPASGPFAVIGGALIDAAPAWAKDTAIAWFGTSDKAALLTGIAVALLVVSAVAGLCEARWRRTGIVAFIAMGLAVGGLSLTRAEATEISWAPSLLAGFAAAGALRLLRDRLPEPESTAQAGLHQAEPPSVERVSPPATSRPSSPGVPIQNPVQNPARNPAQHPTPSRRRFLAWAGGTAAIGIALAIASSAARAGSVAVASVRKAIRLPRPATPAPAIPAGAELDVRGITPLITPNADFYRIDTALVVPTVDPASWMLRIHGMVAREVELSWDELLRLPMTETTATLSCVSNEVGGDLVGNAVWLGVPIRELLARAKPSSGADMVLSTSVDGFTAGTPLETLTDDRDALLAIGMNGEPLPFEHGFPVRMVVPGLYGYVSATKWVTDLEVTRFDRATAYWTDRGWSARGPIKLESRIDVPRAGRALAAGETAIAGIAWQPHVGVAAVEVRIDDGPWRRATLAPAISDDTWVQWSMPWTADTGQHEIRCRAIARDGTVQTGEVAPPAPDGATGWHTIPVTVGN